MVRLFLVLIYVFLSGVAYFLPNIVVRDGQVFVFALICVYLLKELDWMLLKNSCKNSKDKVCKMFRKKDNNQSVDP